MFGSLQKENTKSILSARVWKLLWGLILPLVVFLVLTNQIIFAFDEPNFNFFPLNNGLWLFGTLLLLPINIYLESLKWKVLVQDTTKTSIAKSVKIILAGKSLNTISPFGLGDATVKYLNVHEVRRNQSFGLILLDRVSNMIPTLIFGLISTVFLILEGLTYLSDMMYFMIGIGGLMIIGLLVFSNQLAVLFKKSRKYTSAISALRKGIILSAVGIALVRYVVFSLQFYFVMRWLEISLDFQVLMLGIFWVFFVKTLIPDMTVFGDLVKRELSAITFFSLFLPSMELIIVANVWIWLINIIIPSIFGLFFITDLKKQTL